MLPRAIWAESYDILHIPNVVTTVLASYRGFDTLGETIVVFTAGLGVLLILTGKTWAVFRMIKPIMTSGMRMNK